MFSPTSRAVGVQVGVVCATGCYGENAAAMRGGGCCGARAAGGGPYHHLAAWVARCRIDILNTSLTCESTALVAAIKGAKPRPLERSLPGVNNESSRPVSHRADDLLAKNRISSEPCLNAGALPVCYGLWRSHQILVPSHSPSPARAATVALVYITCDDTHTHMQPALVRMDTGRQTGGTSERAGAWLAWFSGCVRYNAPTTIHTK